MTFKPSKNLATISSNVRTTDIGFELELLEDELLELEVVDELLLDDVLLELLSILPYELSEEVEVALVVTSLVELDVTTGCSLELLDVFSLLPEKLQAANETLANKTNDLMMCFFIGIPSKRKII